MHFRHDINGLRAFAVIAVVVYHFNPQWLSGGFAGVDVFFVISGYLMTSIIFRGLQNNNFSIISFYLARAQRIIPALATLCIVLLVYGWFFLIPNEYATLGMHTFSSMAFISNMTYWGEAGYFTAASHEKWLLHTWSLSVEWQFYLLYPIFLVLLHRFLCAKSIRNLLLIGVVISFVFTVYASQQWAEAAFFLLPTRAWEMLMGGLAFLFPLKLAHSKKVTLEWLGIVLILISYFIFSSKDVWPGYLSGIPVVGTLLVIVSNRQTSFFTANKACQKIGNASYSIYLWHWPVVVFMHKYIDSITLVDTFAAIGISFILGFTSYHLIEKQFGKKSIEKSTKVKLATYFQLITLMAFVVYISNGVISDVRAFSVLPKTVFLEKYARVNYLKTIEESYKQECNFFNGKLYSVKSSIEASCTLKKEGEGVFLWGDSHAQALSFGVQGVLPKDVPFYQVATSGCSVDLVTISTRKTNAPLNVACRRSNQFALEKILSLKPNTVIIAQRKDHDKIPVEELSNMLLSKGIAKVIIVGPVPQWQPSLPEVIAKRHWNKDFRYLEDQGIDHSIIEVDAKLRKISYSSDKVKYISIIKEVCIEKKCLVKVPDNEELIIWDYGHLTNQGATFIASTFITPEL